MVENFDWNLNNTITWDKIFGEHHFTATLVQEAEEHRYWSDNVNARNITPSDALGFHYTQGANKTQSGFSTNDTHYTAASYLGRLFYSFKDRYMFTGTFRRDGYSGFGSNNPWGNFGSVGLSWVFSEENFMSDAHDWMDMGKLRLSWGTMVTVNLEMFTLRCLICHWQVEVWYITKMVTRTLSIHFI